MNEPELKFRARLPDNVADAMRENLSGEVGQLLRQRLEEGDVAIADNQRLIADLNVARKEIEEAGSLKRQRESIAERTKKLDAETATLERLSRDLVNSKLQHELTTEKAVTKTLQDVLMGLVRNTAWRENVFGNVAMPNPQYGGYSSAPENSDITRKAE